ncbi:zinc ribbon domain-containing protein [Paenarthrobacter sp. NPDC089322]|uniref:zinc ribbon domain-containing protein n=1 Tax=Paenarthrobacter sp. NPDC089322 TaxID=3155065 RepID=UPI00342CDB9E
MSAAIQQCSLCQAKLFPARLFCPACGGDSFLSAAVDVGTVSATTTLADGTILATLTLDGGAQVVARLTGTDVEPEPGRTVPLTNFRDAGPGIHAYIPTYLEMNEDSQ